MQDLTGKITGSTLTAAEWNQLPQEVQNVIVALGQTLGSGDLNQLGKSIAGYVANGTFYTDSGAADAYVLTQIGSKQAPTAYTDGFEIDFVAGNPNTGASTVNVAGLGVKNIKLTGGGDPSGGSISDRVKCVFDSSNDWFELIVVSSATGETGEVSGFAMNTAPTGWLKANGAAVSRTTYSALFAAIGTVFGIGDGATTFNLPDARGEFIRGWDDGRGVDTGRVFGSAQADDFESHDHAVFQNTSSNVIQSGANTASHINLSVSGNNDQTSGVTGGVETRPRNIALLYCIKF